MVPKYFSMHSAYLKTQMGTALLSYSPFGCGSHTKTWDLKIIISHKKQAKAVRRKKSASEKEV